MRLGICVGIPAPGAGSAGAGSAGAGPAAAGSAGGVCDGQSAARMAAGLGYDYVEMSLAPLAALDGDGFDYVLSELDGARIKCECLNVMFPAGIRLTGGERDEAAIRAYLDAAFARAHKIGAELVVFGSGGARRIPDGYPYGAAFAQLSDTLKMISETAAAYGIQIAIESLNKNETNVILSLSEAERLMAAAGMANVKLLFDFYHFAAESDSVEDLRRLALGGRIIHMHYAEPSDRGVPRGISRENAAVINALKEGGYDARCSIEARLENPGSPLAEMRSGLAALREIVS